MGTNNFLEFCGTDTGTNLLSQGDYAASSDRTSGNKPGVASSALVNKALRQSAFISSQFAQYIADTLSVNVLDDGNATRTQAQIMGIVRPFPSIRTIFTSSGTWYKTYIFILESGSADAGATYTNNSNTFTVKTTISAQNYIICSGTGSPEDFGTLTLSGGTGDATITFYAVKRAIQIKSIIVGGGAGGGGADGAGAGSGSAASGGGAGGTAIKYFSFSDLTDSVSVTIGTGGSGGTGSGGGDGGAGGETSFGAYCATGQAIGGGGDTGSTTMGPGLVGRSGGTPTGGDINIRGGSSRTGLRFANNAVGGAGGNSLYGSGGSDTRASSSAETGNAAQGYGGGGGGACSGNTASNANGGAGAGGLCIVEEYFQ